MENVAVSSGFPGAITKGDFMQRDQTNNPIYVLSADQTAELRELWRSVRNLVTPERENFIRVKLAAPQARISRKQLFMVMSQLTGLRPEDLLPQWLYELDQKQQQLETCEL
jgi:hypothetical protein